MQFGLALLCCFCTGLVSYALGEANDPYSLTGNYGLQLDLLLFGEKHLYHGEGVAFDPEGLLSTLPSIVNVIAGYLVGDYIRTHKASYETIAKLLMMGAFLILVALTWNMFFPINKKLWTSSFVLLNGRTGYGDTSHAHVCDRYKKEDRTGPTSSLSLEKIHSSSICCQKLG